MKNAVIAAIVAAVVSSGSAYAGVHLFNPSRMRVAHSPVISLAAGQRGWASASCPLGAFATGGGLTSSDIAGHGVTVTDSVPSPIGSRTSIGWTVAVQNTSDVTAQFRAYAVCVR